MIMSLSVKNQSIESSGITKDYKEAICEYIWNGFEANATEINISYSINDLNGIDSITIKDNGDGINFYQLQDTFGAFLASQKNSLSLRIKSKSNKGKGRFSFVCFSSNAEFNTKFLHENTVKKYSIKLTNESKETVEYSELKDANDNHTGTTVSFFNIHQLLIEDMSFEALEEHLLSEFAWYLYLNKHKNVKLILNNVELDYNKRLDTKLSESITKSICGKIFNISLIVWNEKIKEKFKIYYLDSNNVLKDIDTTSFNRNTVDFSHSVFVQSSYFNDWDKSTLPLFIPNKKTDDIDNNKIFRILTKEIQSLIAHKLKVFMTNKADEEINKMIEVRDTFPKFSNDAYGQLRKRDLMRVTKEIYCLEPRIFFKLKDIQEKSFLAFLNLLLSSEERENILTVIDEIVHLSTEQRSQFANLLQKTRLENIIDTISFVEERYKVIEILKSIIYDLDKFANERDHIQRIIENNYWLFGEQYHLVSSDKTMHRALEEYNYFLYGNKTATEPLAPEAEAQRRMDIFLCGARNVETNFGTFIEENIVVELKAPRISLSKTVLRQIEDYMDYIRTKPQFNSQHRKWKFIAVCKEVDEYVKDQYNTLNHYGKPGLVSKSDKYEIYALTWDDVFKSFDLRHSFMLDKLKYNRSALLEEINSTIHEPSRETVDELTKITTEK